MRHQIGVLSSISSRFLIVGFPSGPSHRCEADFLFVQVGFSWDQLLRWREDVAFNGPVYAGVMVVASAGMGRKLSGDIPQLAIPEWLLARLADDPSAGVEHACEMVSQVRD